MGKYNDIRKYLISATLLAVGIFCLFFGKVADHLEETQVENQVVSRKMLVDLMCSTVNHQQSKGVAWNAEAFKEVLLYEVDNIDKAKGTYAEMFDEHMASLSSRNPSEGIRPFVLTDYPDVLGKMREVESGRVQVMLSATEGGSAYPLHLYWRWVPSDPDLPGRYLVVLGVSKHSIDVTYSNMLLYGALVLVVACALHTIWAHYVPSPWVLLSPCGGATTRNF